MLLFVAAAAECVDALTRRKRKLQKLPCPVDQLTGGNIARAADLFRADIFSVRLDEQQLRRAAGEVPRQMRHMHQLHPSRRPQRRRDMPLLVRKRIKRNVQDTRQRLRLRASREEARHIGAIDRARARAGADGADRILRKRGKQFVRHFRQALDVRKQRVGLPQAKLTGPHVQKA